MVSKMTLESDKNSHGSSKTVTKASQNINVLSLRLKAAWDGILQNDSGKRFHAAEPASIRTRKLVGPFVLIRQQVGHYFFSQCFKM